MDKKNRSCNKIYILCTISVAYFARFMANKAEKGYTLINIFFIFLDAATEICRGWTRRQGRNEQTGRTIMQTNPEDKYEVKKFCFVWLAPGMKRGAT